MAAALALLTTLTYGVANWLGPRLQREAPGLVVLIAGQTLSLTLAAVVVAAGGHGLPPAGALGWALLAGTGNAGGLILFFRAAERGPLSVIVPVGSTAAALPVLIGLLGGERLGAAKAAGIVLAILGVFLVARRPRNDRTEDHRTLLVLAGVSTLFFALFLVAMRPASEDGAAWAVLVSRLSLLAILLAFAAREGVLRTGTRPAAGRLPRLAVPGLLLFTGTLSYGAATQQGDLSVVSVLGTLFPAITVGLAVSLDGERLSRAQALGFVLTLGGVVLLSVR